MEFPPQLIEALAQLGAAATIAILAFGAFIYIHVRLMKHYEEQDRRRDKDQKQERKEAAERMDKQFEQVTRAVSDLHSITEFIRDSHK